MEVVTVKIKSLHIKNLYGVYNYDINFNHDVTFIYGANGCGKTTILNITEAIITGQLFKLFDYNFGEILLCYSLSTEVENEKSIEIHKNQGKLNLKFSDECFYVDKIPNIDEELRKYDRPFNDKVRAYFEKYSFLEDIKKTFNYVYLPLNRSEVVHDDDEYLVYRRMRQRNTFGIEQLSEPDTKDLTMMQVEYIIKSNVGRINSEIAKVSDNFRNDILKSLIDVNNQQTFESLLDSLTMERDNEEYIRQTQNDYIKILNDLSLINDEEKETYNVFFKNIIENFKSVVTNSKKISIDLVLKYIEILKIENLVKLSENLEKQKSEIRKPIDVLLKTMNEFVNKSDDGKRIIVNSLGKVYFVTKYNNNPVSIQYLSSGEKQLITFFTHLIFNVKNNSSGIFVVDEPELSLHLSWQKNFVEKTMEINENIQLIFATHSPEIIGRHRSKMYKLEKIYIGKGGEASE